jgi:hypothetical protein
MTLVIKGFRCIEPTPDGQGKPRPLSSVFLVKAAAEAFVELARRTGHPTATLETVYSVDDAGAL